jgi:hypothetical protein
MYAICASQQRFAIVCIFPKVRSRVHPTFAKIFGDFQEAVGELVEGQAPHLPAVG